MAKNNKYKQRLIDNNILDFTRRKKGIVYGAKALNERLPEPLRKKTTDFDVFMNKPRIRAHKLQKKLDNIFQKDLFYAKRAQHEGTWKVKSRGKDLKDPKDDYTVADLTRPEEKIPYRTSFGGIRFVKLSYLKRKALESLKNKESKHRWEKDREMLKRIRRIKRIRKKIMGGANNGL